jgi:hypothetical protein
MKAHGLKLRSMPSMFGANHHGEIAGAQQGIRDCVAMPLAADGRANG